MKLSDLHARLSRNASYRKAYDAIGDVVLVGAAIRSLREQEGITQEQLGQVLEVSQFYLSRLETGSGKVPPGVVAAAVRRFEGGLRMLGINVGPWLAIEPAKPNPRARPAPYERQPAGIPASVSRSRHSQLAQEPERIVREKPSHKYGSKAGKG